MELTKEQLINRLLHIKDAMKYVRDLADTPHKLFNKNDEDNYRNLCDIEIACDLDNSEPEKHWIKYSTLMKEREEAIEMTGLIDSFLKKEEGK